MLVIVSDIHLTDGTSGMTIHSGAFEKFTLYLKDMAETAKAKEVEIVLLGDIIDLIRSDYWLRSDIRPWSKPGDKDEEGNELKDYTTEILKRICNNSGNKQSIAHLKKFKDEMAKQGVSVKITYIIGNHDWLINRYPETRTKVARFFDIEDPNQYKNKMFATERLWEDYKVFARHGDIYDPFNFDGDRDASSLGDAIVIDLVNRFPEAVKSEIGEETERDLILKIQEIDHVRPLLDIPLWIHGACRRSKLPGTEKQVKKVWNKLVKKFLKMKFVKKHDTWWPMEAVDALQLALEISTVFSLKDIVNSPIRKLFKKRRDYVRKAYREEYRRKNMVEFIVYGHTHHHQVVPLDVVPLDPVPIPGRFLQSIYFNTGTWRRIHENTAFDKKNQKFLSRDVMTFIAFYLKEERGGRRFEVWNGALG
jgi:UDP-2,3-diacylglucosamine pyrophosphatase LpxH